MAGIASLIWTCASIYAIDEIYRFYKSKMRERKEKSKNEQSKEIGPRGYLSRNLRSMVSDEENKKAGQHN